MGHICKSVSPFYTWEICLGDGHVMLHLCSYMFAEMRLLWADYSPVIILGVVWQGIIWVPTITVVPLCTFVYVKTNIL